MSKGSTINTETSKVPSGLVDHYATYPNGAMINQNFFYYTVPVFNPENKMPNELGAHVYGYGTYSEITSSCAIVSANREYVVIKITYNSSYVGKLLRISLAF